MKNGRERVTVSLTPITILGENDKMHPEEYPALASLPNVNDGESVNEPTAGMLDICVGRTGPDSVLLDIVMLDWFALMPAIGNRMRNPIGTTILTEVFSGIRSGTERFKIYDRFFQLAYAWNENPVHCTLTFVAEKSEMKLVRAKTTEASFCNSIVGVNTSTIDDTLPATGG